MIGKSTVQQWLLIDRKRINDIEIYSENPLDTSMLIDQKVCSITIYIGDPIDMSDWRTLDVELNQIIH